MHPVSEFLQVQHMGNGAGVTCAKSRNGKREDILRITRYISVINRNKLINCGLWCIICGERNILSQNMVYRSLSEDPANIYSFLLVAGYLKTPAKELQADGAYLCEISITNREISDIYKSEILSHLLQIGAITRTTENKIAESLYANDLKKLQQTITEDMMYV